MSHNREANQISETILEEEGWYQKNKGRSGFLSLGMGERSNSQKKRESVHLMGGKEESNYKQPAKPVKEGIPQSLNKNKILD